MDNEAKRKQIHLFNANREQLITSIRSAISVKDYQSAISLSEPWLEVGYDELNQLFNQAKSEFAEKRKLEKTDKLLKEIKTLPVREYEKNKNLYQQLVDLHPDNQLYIKKVSFYSDKIEAVKRKQRAAEARKNQIESQFSPWDGSHLNLKSVIRELMNDPDSFKHYRTDYWDKGDHLIVSTHYGGRNAFGGMVRGFVKAKVGLDGQILQIIESD